MRQICRIRFESVAVAVAYRCGIVSQRLYNWMVPRFIRPKEFLEISTGGRGGEVAHRKLIPSCRAISNPRYIIRYITSDPVVTRNYDSRAKHFADRSHFFFGFADVLETPGKIRRRGFFVRVGGGSGGAAR